MSHLIDNWLCTDCGDRWLQYDDFPLPHPVWWNEGDGDLCASCHARRDAERACGKRPTWEHLPAHGCPRNAEEREQFARVVEEWRQRWLTRQSAGRQDGGRTRSPQPG